MIDNHDRCEWVNVSSGTRQNLENLPVKSACQQWVSKHCLVTQHSKFCTTCPPHACYMSKCVKSSLTVMFIGQCYKCAGQITTSVKTSDLRFHCSWRSLHVIQQVDTENSQPPWLQIRHTNTADIAQKFGQHSQAVSCSGKEINWVNFNKLLKHYR